MKSKATTAVGCFTAVLIVAAVSCGGSDQGAGKGADSSTTTASAPPPVDSGTGGATFATLGTDTIDVTHYDLDFRWDPATELLDATAKLELTAREEIATVALDFGPQLAVGEVSASVAGGDPSVVEFSQSDGKLLVPLGESVDAGTAVVVSVTYGGSPEPVTSVAPIPVGWIVNEGGVVATLSEPDAAHQWFPGNDHPTDKATFTTRITAPETLVSVANGVRSGEPVPNGDGTATSTWVMDAPMATYLALVAIDDFTVSDDGVTAGVPIRNYLPAGEESTFAGGMGSQPSMVSFMVDRLGPFPFTEYGAVVVAGGPVALETQGRSLFQGPSARDRSTVIHELTHQWMGDSVSITSWGQDIWWVEGFARFSEWLWAERAEGPGGYAERAELAYQGLQLGDRIGLAGVEPAALFDSDVYDGGALVFYQLRSELGDEVFFGAMRTFCERYRHGNATTDDLIAVFSEAAGRDMAPTFEPWLAGGSVPPLAFG